MTAMFNSLLVKLGLRKDVGAPVHSGINPVYFTDVYENDGKGFTFSWRSADHSEGMVRDDFRTLEDANVAREYWTSHRSMTEHATFVHDSPR